MIIGAKEILRVLIPQKYNSFDNNTYHLTNVLLYAQIFLKPSALWAVEF